MNRVWSISYPDTGEIRECRSLRTLLWSVYEPLWLWKLRQPFVDYFDVPKACRKGNHKWYSFGYPHDDFEECSARGTWSLTGRRRDKSVHYSDPFYEEAVVTVTDCGPHVWRVSSFSTTWEDGVRVEKQLYFCPRCGSFKGDVTRTTFVCEE